VVAAATTSATTSVTTLTIGPRGLLLLAGAIYGTYPVLLRANAVIGKQPLPATFITFVRYQFLTLFAALLRAFRTFQSRRGQPPPPTAGNTREGDSEVANPAKRAQIMLRSFFDDGSDSRAMWTAAAELGLYTVISSLLAVAGLSRVSALTSEILISTMHLFVPLQAYFLLGRSGFGARTWAGCGMAFGAALLTSIADGMAGGGSSDGTKAVELVGSSVLVGSAFAFSLSRVRAQVHVRKYDPERLNSARMVCMGVLSALALLAEVIAGGPSRSTLTQLHTVLPTQWLLMGLSVFLSAFLASHLQFVAMQAVSAANAQPFAALQPLWTALWSALVLAEPISGGSLLGGVLMVGAALLAATDSSGLSGADNGGNGGSKTS